MAFYFVFPITLYKFPFVDVKFCACLKRADVRLQLVAGVAFFITYLICRFREARHYKWCDSKRALSDEGSFKINILQGQSSLAVREFVVKAALLGFHLWRLNYHCFGLLQGWCCSGFVRLDSGPEGLLLCEWFEFWLFLNCCGGPPHMRIAAVDTFWWFRRLECDILSFCLFDIEGLFSILRFLSKQAGHAPIWLNEACALDAWDEEMDAVDVMGIDGASRTNIYRFNTRLISEVSVPASDGPSSISVNPRSFPLSLRF